MSFYQHGMSLKALLEDPNLLVPPKQDNTDGKKDKDGLDLDNHLFLGQSAFLGPQLWDKTYDEADLKLEFMDLDEFLNENEIATAGSPPSGEMVQNSHQQPLNIQVTPSPISPTATTLPPTQLTATPSPPLPAINPSLIHQMSPPQTSPQASNSPPQISSPPGVHPSQSPVQLDGSPGPFCEEDLDEYGKNVKSVQKRNMRQKDAESIVTTDLEPYAQDIMLATIPGEEFDPRNRRFSADELRPQPLIKKSRKIFVPNEMKDDKYWARRRKNNVAAQRSRDARRTKENQIAMRALYLEQQSESLAKELEKAKKENQSLRERLAKYEPEVVNK